MGVRGKDLDAVGRSAPLLSPSPPAKPGGEGDRRGAARFGARTRDGFTGDASLE
jgi:hypothetical protein